MDGLQWKTLLKWMIWGYPLVGDVLPAVLWFYTTVDGSEVPKQPPDIFFETLQRMGYGCFRK